ncbi:ABC transporter permease [Microtetraspora glauca]|uniref:ABC transporter permease n=1 Tax=Microtetraspora glauca TaxID=1996 RepID=UPI003F4D58F7
MTVMEVARPKLSPARMRPRDVMRVGAVGLRTRPLRAFLSALGIAIGIAAMVSVVGLSSSSGAELDRTLSALGTNLLTVSSGATGFMTPTTAKRTPPTTTCVSGPIEPTPSRWAAEEPSTAAG